MKLFKYVSNKLFWYRINKLYLRPYTPIKLGTKMIRTFPSFMDKPSEVIYWDGSKRQQDLRVMGNLSFTRNN